MLEIRSIQQLRNAEDITKLVYISCSPEQAIKNWIDLMKPVSKTLKGNPFIPKIARPIDLFPHTPHTELIILFERQVDAETDNQ
jgi:tRNA (uracil-5-)-methyltransferase